MRTSANSTSTTSAKARPEGFRISRQPADNRAFNNAGSSEDDPESVVRGRDNQFLLALIAADFLVAARLGQDLSSI
jgi:hypothetical protein